MKSLHVLPLGLMLLTLACAEEKFEEKRGAGLRGDGESLAEEGKQDEPIEVSVEKDDKTEVESSDDTLEGGDCAKMLGVEQVKISGSAGTETITSKDGYSLRVTGSKNNVSIELKGADAAAKSPGLCLDLTGNQNHVNVKVLLQLGTVYVRARGNQALVSFDVAKDAKIGEVKVDAAGHEPGIAMKGEGKFPCTASADKKPISIACPKAP